MATEGGGGIEVLPEPEGKGKHSSQPQDIPSKKRKTFHPLKSLKRWFSGRKRNKNKNDDMFKANSVDKLQSEASGDEDRVPHRSQSENSVFLPSTQPQYKPHTHSGLARVVQDLLNRWCDCYFTREGELQGRVGGHHGDDDDEDEGMPSSPPPHTTTVDALIENGMKEKSMSLDSDHSLLSVESSEIEQEDDFFHERWSVGSPVGSPPQKNSSPVGKVDLDSVHSTSNLNLAYQKHKLEVRQKAKHPSAHPNRNRRTASPSPKPVLLLVAEESKGPNEESSQSEGDKSFGNMQSPDDSLDSRKLPDFSTDDEERVGGLDLSTDEGVDEGDDDDLEVETAVEQKKEPKVELIKVPHPQEVLSIGKPEVKEKNQEKVEDKQEQLVLQPEQHIQQEKTPIKEMSKHKAEKGKNGEKEEQASGEEYEPAEVTSRVLKKSSLKASLSNDSNKADQVATKQVQVKTETKKVVIEAAAEVHRETPVKRTSVEVVVIGGKDISDMKGVIGKDVAMEESKREPSVVSLRREAAGSRDVSKRQTIAVTAGGTTTNSTIFGERKKRLSYVENSSEKKADEGENGAKQGSEFSNAFEMFNKGRGSKKKSDAENQAVSLEKPRSDEKENKVQISNKSSVSFVGGPTIPNVRSPLSPSAPSESAALKDTSNDKNIKKSPEKKVKPPILSSKPTPSPTANKSVIFGQSKFVRDSFTGSTPSNQEKRSSLILEKTPKKLISEPKTVVIEKETTTTSSVQKTVLPSQSVKDKTSGADGSYQRTSPLLRNRDRSRTAPVGESDSPRVSVQRASSTASSGSGHPADVTGATKSTTNLAKSGSRPVSTNLDRPTSVLKSSAKTEPRKLSTTSPTSGKPSWMDMAKQKKQSWGSDETKNDNESKTNVESKKEAKPDPEEKEATSEKGGKASSVLDMVKSWQKLS